MLSDAGGAQETKKSNACKQEKPDHCQNGDTYHNVANLDETLGASKPVDDNPHPEAQELQHTRCHSRLLKCWA
jgi:hypothetical protein